MSSSKNRFMKKISFTALAMTFAVPAFAADANPVTVDTSGSFKFYGNLDSGVEVCEQRRGGQGNGGPSAVDDRNHTEQPGDRSVERRGIGQSDRQA